MHYLRVKHVLHSSFAVTTFGKTGIPCFRDCFSPAADSGFLPWSADSSGFGWLSFQAGPGPFLCVGVGILEQNWTTRESAGRRAVILVVEDDRSIRYLFTEVLRGDGHSVIACEDGDQALQTARAQIHEIDAILTDSRMPGLSGRELVSAIRALRADVPVLVVSGSLDQAAAQDGGDLATVFLCKPVSPEQLKAELRRLLYGRM